MNFLFTSNIAYGKTLSPHYKDNYQTITDGVFYDDIDKSFRLYDSNFDNVTLTVDLEKTTSISSVIIHILSMSHTPAPTSVFVSQDGVSTSSSAKYCGTTSVPKKSDLIVVRCSKPLTGRYVTLSFMYRHYTYVKEVVITGGSTTAIAFGSATLNNRGGVDGMYDRVIMIPDRTESFQAALGTVTGWKVSAKRSKPVHLAFWRPSGHGQYTYVGGTDYTPPRKGVYEIKLRADEQFEIQQGDVVGIEWRQGGAIRFTNILPCRANNVKHLIHTHPSPTHSKTTPVYFSESDRCGPYQILAQVNQ